MVQFPNAILYQKKGASPTFQFESHPLEAQPFGDHLPERWRESATPFALPPMLPPWRGRENAFPTSISPPRQKGLRPRRTENLSAALPATSPSALPAEPSTQASASEKMYAQGHLANAEAQALIEVAEKPEDAAALTLLARICANQGRLDEALAWCKRALAADRLNLRGHYLCATIQQERGEEDEAILALKRALYLHPEFVLAHFALGYLARQQGKKREADRHFTNMFALLNQYPPDAILPESDGLTAGRLAEMVRSSTIDLAAIGGKLQ
jgi:chemotaxis protein methyltransferase CheR